MYREQYTEYEYEGIPEIPRDDLHAFEEARLGSAKDTIPVLDHEKSGALIFSGDKPAVDAFADTLDTLGISYTIEDAAEGRLHRILLSNDADLLRSYHDGECHLGEFLGLPAADRCWWTEFGYESDKLDDVPLDDLKEEYPGQTMYETRMSIYTTGLPHPSQDGIDRDVERAQAKQESLAKYEKRTGVPVLTSLIAISWFYAVLGDAYSSSSNRHIGWLVLYILLAPVWLCFSLLRSTYIRARYG